MHFRCRYFWNRTTWTSLDLQLCVRVQQLHTKKWLRRETTTDLLTFTNHNRREVHRRYIRCRTVKNYAPLIFDGVHRDPEEWLAHFRRYVACLNLSEADQLAFFPLFLQHRAIDWYDTLKPQDRTTIDQLLGEVNRFFCPSALERALDVETVFTRVQRPSQKLRDYFLATQKLAKLINHL